MAENSKTVVLCKSLSEKDNGQEVYKKTLKSAGYICKYLCTLQFKFINTSELRTCLLAANKYSGNI